MQTQSNTVILIPPLEISKDGIPRLTQEILVRSLAGRRFPLMVHSSLFVVQVKDLVASKLGIKAEDIRLIFDKKNLLDGESLTIISPV